MVNISQHSWMRQQSCTIPSKSLESLESSDTHLTPPIHPYAEHGHPSNCTFPKEILGVQKSNPKKSRFLETTWEEIWTPILFEKVQSMGVQYIMECLENIWTPIIAIVLMNLFA